MIKLLRAMLGLDSKLLPDSMTTEEFGKFIEDQKGKLLGNPEDIKNLQKLISKKDVDFRKTKEALEKLKSKKPKDDKKESESEKIIKGLNKKLDDIGEKMAKIDKANETINLQKKYPDIMPELLVGKDEEAQKAVVEKQRAMNKKLYGDSRHFTQPSYNDVDEIDKEMDDVKEDKSLSGEKSAVKLLQLSRTRENFQPDLES